MKMSKASLAQKKYCEKENIAPDQYCYYCHHDIYADVQCDDGEVSHGYTEEYAATPCPHCHYSFVE